MSHISFMSSDASKKTELILSHNLPEDRTSFPPSRLIKYLKDASLLSSLPSSNHWFWVNPMSTSLESLKAVPPDSMNSERMDTVRRVNLVLSAFIFTANNRQSLLTAKAKTIPYVAYIFITGCKSLWSRGWLLV